MTIANLSMPFQVGWDITHHCNFRCKHCFFTEAELSDTRAFSLEEALGFVRYLGSKGVFHLSLAGGEPLLYPHLVEVVAEATRQDMVVAMSTNASLLTDSLASALYAAGLRSLQISLDGSRAELHDYVRGHGTFERTMRGLKTARKHGFSVVVACVILKSNIDDIKSIFALAEAEEATALKVQTLIELGLGADHLQEIEVDERALKAAIRDLWELKTSRRSHTTLLLPLIPEVADLAKKANEHYYKDSSCLGCQPGLTTVRVNATGDVRACGAPSPDAEIVGNVLKEDFQAMWRHSRELVEWRNASNVTQGNSTSCGSICGTGCRATTAPDFAK